MAEVTDFQDKTQKWEARTLFDRDEGLVIIPLAKGPLDPPPHYRIVRRHAPVGMKYVEATGSKTGTPPVMPTGRQAPNSGGQPAPPGDVLVKTRIDSIMPQDANSGVERMHCVQTVHTYVEQPDGEARARVPGIDPYPGVRPPYPRIGTDTVAAVDAGENLGGAAAGLIEAAAALFRIPGKLDEIYDRLGDPGGAAATGIAIAQVDLTDPAYVEMSTDLKPDYFSDNLIRDTPQ